MSFLGRNVKKAKLGGYFVDSSLEQKFLECLRQLNCKYEKHKSTESNVHNYSFVFQAESFYAQYYVLYNRIYIFYNGFYASALDNLNIIRQFVNTYNNKCLFHKLTYGVFQDGRGVWVSAEMMIDELTVDSLTDMLNSMFSIKHDFIVEIEKEIKENRGGYYRDIEYHDAMGLRELVLSRELEISHQPEDGNYRSSYDSSFTLEDYLKVSCKNLNLKGVKYNKLRILVDETMSVYDDENFIRDLPLHLPLIEYKRDYIEADEKEYPFFANDSAVMIVDFIDGEGKEHSLTINVNTEGQDSVTLYYKAYSLQCPDNIGRTIALDEKSAQLAQGASSIMLAYDNGDVKKKLQEFDFMWKEAQDKVKNNDTSLTEGEALLGSFVTSHSGFHFYWGQRCFAQGCYAQALKHFLNVFNSIKAENVSNINEGMERICYYIAFCYTELGMLENAYYYVELLRGSNNIEHLMELVNVLANAGDMRVLYYIDSYLKMISDNFGDQEACPENIAKFASFLRRRRAYSLINFGKLDEAEKEFKALLDDPDSNDYALHELAYIQRLRNGNQDGDKGGKE